MKFLNVMDLFEGEPAALAIFSTFQFDPDFFEQRLLRSTTLAQARRILIFMDARQWLNLLGQAVPARHLNRRYLVVPVHPPRGGAFHPKLNLIIGETGGQVQCGSNNLTRSGCSNNLELLNAVPVSPDDTESVRLAQDAHAFFRRACADAADPEMGRIARQWLEELPPWLANPIPAQDHEPNLRLIHSYSPGTIWDQITTALHGVSPKKLFVISPFYDLDGEMVQRIHSRWPKCQIELVAQQNTTNLPVSSLKKMRNSVSLSELRNSQRRLHAKLLAWESPKGSGCLVGSANLTTAAFDGRNVETCFLVPDAQDSVSRLFDKQLSTRPISLQDFTPGTNDEADDNDMEKDILRMNSAILTESGELKVSYQHHLISKPSCLRAVIRTPGEKHPRTFLNLANKQQGTAVFSEEEVPLKDISGAVMASLAAEIDGKPKESLPIWVVQEAKLTCEPSDREASSAKTKVEETGDGLPEFLEELGKRDGMPAVIEYLRLLNIRFFAGDGSPRTNKMFRLRIRDPFQPDVAPEWLLHAKAETDNLAAAIYDFADRHEKDRLRRHTRSGNINGMENFLDVFTALVRLLYVYHVRGVVSRNQLMPRICNYIAIASGGLDDSHPNACVGYLHSVCENIGDTEYLQEACRELNFLGHIGAALVIAQKVRYEAGDQQVKNLGECLMAPKRRLYDAIASVNLAAPSPKEVMAALEQYNMFSPTELTELKEKSVASLWKIKPQIGY